MIRTLTIDGKSSEEFDIFLDAKQIYGSAEKDFTNVDIAGRNGTLTIDNNRFKDKTIPYSCYIRKRAPELLKEFQAFLLSRNGRVKLEDSYDQECYRIGQLTGEIDFDTLSSQHKSGEFTLNFNCHPMRFLYSGDLESTYEASGTITNPTYYASLPIIRIYGFGTVTIGDVVVTVETPGDEYIEINCESGAIEENGINRAGNVALTNYQLPELASGENIITLDSTITKVVITPKWVTV